MTKAKKRQTTRRRIVFISFFFFPATFVYLSPYVIVDASAKGIISGSFITFTLLFISSLVFGRAFCSWACPIGGGQEMLAPVKKKFAVKGRFVKWLLWTPWMIAIILLAIQQDGYQKLDPFYRTNHGFSLGSIYTAIAYVVVLLLIIGSHFAVGKRSFCRHICWIAPFMIIGSKIQNLLKLPALKLVRTENDCNQCGRCSRSCHMGLDVSKMVNENKLKDTECILCGNCADNCTRSCLKLTIHN